MYTCGIYTIKGMCVYNHITTDYTYINDSGFTVPSLTIGFLAVLQFMDNKMHSVIISHKTLPLMKKSFPNEMCVLKLIYPMSLHLISSAVILYQGDNVKAA